MDGWAFKGESDMSKIIGVTEVKKRRLTAGYKCYQLDYQCQGQRSFKRVVAKNMSEAGDMRTEWIKGVKKQNNHMPLSNKDYSAIWHELEVIYGKSKTREELLKIRDKYAKDPQKSDIVRDARKRNKKISCYRKVFNRMFIDDWSGRVATVKDIDEQFFDDYKYHYCYVLCRLSGWKSEQIKAKAILRQISQKRYLLKDQMEEMKQSKAWKKAKSKQKEYPMISDADMKSLLRVIKKERPDFYRIYMFMLRTGRRVEEVTLLLRKNIVFERGKFKALYVRASDAKMERRSYLETVDAGFEELLWDAYQDSECHNLPYLFLSMKHRKCDQRRLCDYLKTKSQQILGEGITNHYFRHRFLTKCGQARIPWSEISKISGLKDQKVYMDYYDHSSQEGQRKVFALTEGIV